MQYEWVIGEYKGAQAKHVLGLADAGVGYFIQRSAGSGLGTTVYVAFRRVIDGPRPPHLELANAMQVQKLETLYQQRHGSLHGGR